jgi:hypothetical protein
MTYFEKCIILPSDSIFFGSGGSQSIIVLTKDKKAYKFYPYTFYSLSKNIDKNVNEQKKNSIVEINIGKCLTKNIVEKNITPHFVKFYGWGVCSNIYKLFEKCPKFIDYIQKGTTSLCEDYFKGYPVKKYNKEYTVVSMEYCNYSSSKFIEDISKMKLNKIKENLDVFFFQIYYTLIATQKTYPNFYHRDLFMRNILGIENNPSNNYDRYYCENKIFDIPVIKFTSKITDFGMTNLNEKYSDTILTKTYDADFFTILYDVYNGGNLGSKSLSELLKKNKIKLNFIKKYFNTFFNVKIVDKFIKSNKIVMDWGWNNIFDKDFRDKIELKSPKHILNEYFLKLYPYDETHVIRQTFNC